MRNKVFLACLLGIFSQTVHAQMVQDDYHSMVQEGKRWDVIDKWLKVKEWTYYIKGDTLIGDKVWKKVFSNLKPGTVSINDYYSYFAAMREEGDRVYTIASGSERQHLLYDFGLKVGDKFSCGRGGTIRYILEEEEESEDRIEDAEMKLLGIDNVIIGGKTHRRFLFYFNFLSAKIYVSFPYVVWIEGIGSNMDPFDSWRPSSPQYQLVKCTIDGEMQFDYEDFGNIVKEAVGISCVQFSPDKKRNLFDLQGRRLSAMPAKGVYIEDGKKWVVK